MLGTGAENNVHDTNAKKSQGGLGTQTSTDKRNCAYLTASPFQDWTLKLQLIIVINTVLAINIIRTATGNRNQNRWI